ncbi:putative aldouronate transport system permease protein [Paenibacillus eucommiae]|uniref:Aldouronate transport system permease protein n=2 Tax=Paenibacillus eucommiae TaxID=1355755 RepID=A0ABS4IVZ2_9BACL|nr:carbohydrate ABC transporter permease [Paenibacillus eucommiae]MBP1991762.1 putative aldouronate transport system permease protein [Paenibacillus eucommiae]
MVKVEKLRQNRIGQTKGDQMFSVLNYLILSMTLLIVLYPLVFVLIASLSSPETVIRGEVWIWPKGFNLDAYSRVFQNKDIMSGYLNTIMYTIAGTAINLVMTVLAAYPLSRKDLKGRNVIVMFMMFTMFFSGGLIPTYMIIKNMGLINTFWAMVIPNAVSVFNIIIMRTFFQHTIPNEVQEAAVMDGCSNMNILVRVVLPLSMPIIAVMILFYGVGHWNAYFNALIYLSDRDKYPLQLILREILVQNQTQDMMDLNSESSSQQALVAASIKYAVIIVTNVPVLLLYPFLQKYFVKGVMVGAIKG